PARVQQLAAGLGASLEGMTLIDIEADPDRMEWYAQQFYRARQRKGVTLAEARERMRQPIYYGCMMVQEGDADGLVAGEEMHYPDTIRPALEAVGTAEGVHRVAGLYLMVMEKDLLFFADTTVNIEPDVETLADIALLAASVVRKLGIRPRVAMLSFSNFGSARHPHSDRVRLATELVKSRDPELII